jgi:hypothetical protein
MVRKLMWPMSAYEMINPVPADAPPPVTHRQVPLFDQPPPELAREEHIISLLKRALLVSDTPVLAPTDPAVQQASYRDRIIPAVTYAGGGR